MSEKHININVIYFELCKKPNLYLGAILVSLSISSCVCVQVHACVYVCVKTHCKEITLKKIKENGNPRFTLIYTFRVALKNSKF